MTEAKTATNRKRTTEPAGRFRRLVRSYGFVPVVAAIAALTLIGAGTVTTVITGRPDAGLFSADGPLAQNRTNPDGKGTGGDNAGTRDGDTASDAGDVRVDLNEDGEPDTRLDGNNDGDTNDSEDPTIAEVVDQRDTLTETVAADPETSNTSETLLTPSGAGWWDLVISVAPELQFDDIAAPKANYYAVTTHTLSDNYLVENSVTNVYQALHIGFDTVEAADAFRAEAVASKNAQWRFPLQRGAVLTYAPPWANPNDEPYPSKANANLRPKAGTWSVNIGRQNSEAAAQAPAYGDVIATYYRSLGFTDSTFWNAVSTNPQGPWTGTLTGYDADAVNVSAAGQALANTAVYDCVAPESCIEVDNGFIDIAYGTAWVRPDGSGVGINTNLLPSDAPADAVLRFGYVPGLVTGVFNGTSSAFTGPLGYTQGWITDSGTMVRYLVPGDAPPAPQ